MKKILSSILLLSAISIGCLFPTGGIFALSSMDSGMSQSMDYEMTGNMKMPCNSKNDSTHMHECCKSPFLESLAYSGNSSFSDSDQDAGDNSDTYDVDVLYSLHESLIAHNLHRLNSPPKYQGFQHDISSNTYTTLVGIIKNNS